MSGHANVQTLGHSNPDPIESSSADRCTVELSTVDALSVGLSLRTLARQRHMPPGTAEVYTRVGKQLEAAARRELEVLRRARAK